MSQQPVIHSRRFTSRVEAADGVWVFWSADGREDTSKVRNLSLGGMFLETPVSKKVDSTLKLDFLVQEGQISADAIVRRAEPKCGLALKFTAMGDDDRLRLDMLVNRLRHTAANR
ncbi:MAG: hypothetical protein DMG40_11945 [Acidobacteria bacterium]|nr:MAG: hypothetical protein DMG40_11945 [Acidobacteriota bacterium]